MPSDQRKLIMTKAMYRFAPRPFCIITLNPLLLATLLMNSPTKTGFYIHCIGAFFLITYVQFLSPLPCRRQFAKYTSCLHCETYDYCIPN